MRVSLSQSFLETSTLRLNVGQHGVFAMVKEVQKPTWPSRPNSSSIDMLGAPS